MSLNVGTGGVGLDSDATTHTLSLRLKNTLDFIRLRIHTKRKTILVSCFGMVVAQREGNGRRVAAS